MSFTKFREINGNKFLMEDHEETRYKLTQTVYNYLVREEELLIQNSNKKLHYYRFFKSIGSPKFIVGPLVHQSELAF